MISVEEYKKLTETRLSLTQQVLIEILFEKQAFSIDKALTIHDFVDGFKKRNISLSNVAIYANINFLELHNAVSVCIQKKKRFLKAFYIPME